MSENPIMHLYYTNRTVLFCMCAGNELFYAALYVLHFTPGPLIGKLMNFMDSNEYRCFVAFLAGCSLFKVLVYFSAPVAIVKSAISVLHCIVACKNLSIIDVNERKAIAEKVK